MTATIAAATAAASKSSGTPILSSAVVAAIVSAVVALATFALAGRRQRLDRQRQVFADAFATCTEYREFPYIVRRRRADDGHGERARISTELSAVQARMNQYVARLRVEAPRVGAAYRELVAQTRATAGPAIKAGWDLPPASSDADVHVTDVDLSAIDPFDDAYLLAVADHLAISPSWARRVVRRLRGHRSGH
ncbi:MAG: hypothetical protein M3Q30_20920 [Actinomycetota bacterium]|nr:hypothetical protein [Actinomycetota bacterium]